MVPTVSVQHRLLGIMMQFHTLLDMKAGDMELHLHLHYDFGNMRCVSWSIGG